MAGMAGMAAHPGSCEFDAPQAPRECIRPILSANDQKGKKSQFRFNLLRWFWEENRFNFFSFGPSQSALEAKLRSNPSFCWDVCLKIANCGMPWNGIKPMKTSYFRTWVLGHSECVKLHWKIVKRYSHLKNLRHGSDIYSLKKIINIMLL